MCERLKSAAGLALLLAFLLATLSGCSMIRVGYGQADTLAAWNANEYFDLDGPQRHEFLARFDRLHEGHRHEQLPEYAAFLEAAKSRLQKGLRREDVIWFVDGLKSRYRIIVNRGVTDAADLLATLTPAQLDNLQRQWDKDNRKFIREHKLEDGQDERKQARAIRTLKQFKDWVGSLSYEQEQKLTVMIDNLPLIDDLRHQDRLRRQREFLQLLSLRGNKAGFTAGLRHWLLNWEQGRTPEYDRQLGLWWDQRVQFFVEAYRLLTPHQRAIAAHRLQDYSEDFRALSARGERSAAR